MEGTVQTAPQGYDFRQHDQLWQRVGPALEPYPQGPAAPAQQSAPGAADLPAPAPAVSPGGLTAAQAAALPGAEADPCCMGSEASELLAVLGGYIREELEDRRRYLALSRQAPAWARQTLRQMAEDEGGHARRLLAARYLITGQSFQPERACGPIYFGPWQEELRRSYHQEACGGLNYARSADSTPDPCLSGLLSDLSAEEYRHARTLMDLLERGLGRRSTSC